MYPPHHRQVTRSFINIMKSKTMYTQYPPIRQHLHPMYTNARYLSIVIIQENFPRPETSRPLLVVHEPRQELRSMLESMFTGQSQGSGRGDF